MSLFKLKQIQKDKTLDEINNEIQTSMISGGKNDKEVQLKIKETFLINSLKKESQPNPRNGEWLVSG